MCGKPTAFDGRMIQNMIDQNLKKQARRLIGDELMLIRELVRHGKRLRIKEGKPVYFEPPIFIKTSATVSETIV